MTDHRERRCPQCADTDLVIEGGRILCKKCGRILSIERLEAPPLEDQEWVKSARIQ